MIDNRVILPENYILLNNNISYKIADEVGRGANCIVYNASYIDSAGLSHLARVKELYPIYLPIKRNEAFQINCEESHREKFEEAKRRFEGAYEKNVSFRSIYGVMNSTVNAADRFLANGTEYVVMNLDDGEDYRSYQDMSLTETLVHVKTLASVILKYHKDGYLHLDIKPENILVIPETAEHVYLFDFDSVCRISDLQSHKIIDLSFSEGFSAPELVQGRISKIGIKTDIYAVGALLFFKLFNRKATFEEGRYSARFDYKEMPFYDERLRPAFFRILDEFFHKTLATSISLRWNTLEQVVDALDTLIDCSDLESAYLINTFTYNSANFIGRANELDEIHEKIHDNNALFLSGIGGIGKTEIAKKFITEYRDEFDTVAFAYYQESIEHTICQEILINNMSMDEEEKESDYFDRVIEVLRKTTSERDLILLDNFDVERDDRLEELLKCPCKFLITTRNRNIKDWNYNEVIIDSMVDEDDLWSLFATYNDVEYEETETKAISKLIDFVDGHTMTVELISKYLRDSGLQPSTLYQRFLEKSGITNTDDNVIINQRKDHKMNSESVNKHLSILFDVFDFGDEEKEVMSSISLFAGIRINRKRFESLCRIENISENIDKLINEGWVEFNENTDKISLHQVIQDLIYSKLNPTTQNCSSIAEGMYQYITEGSENNSERRIKRKVYGIFADRIGGDDFLYAKICLEHGEESKIEEAIQICHRIGDEESYAVLTELYMKKVKILCQCDDMFEVEESLEEYCEKQMMQIDTQVGHAIEACKKAYLSDYNKQVFELLNLAKRVDSQMNELMLNGCFDEVEEVDSVYQKIIEILDLIDEEFLGFSISYDEKENAIEFARDFYSDDDFYAMYRCDHYSDIEKIDYYQELLDELRQEKDDSDSTIVIHTGDKSHSDLGDDYMNKGDYISAIKMYKKAYDNDEEPWDWILPRLSKAYYKTDDVDSAIECLVEVLDYDKRNIKSKDAFAHYSGYVCLDLVKILIEKERLDEAKEYAKELVTYLEPEIKANEDNTHYINDVLDAYWYLYYLENDQANKRRYWDNCVAQFQQLKDVEQREYHLEFLREYLLQDDITYDEIVEIVNRFNPWYGNGEKMIALVDEIISYHQGTRTFVQYQIQLLIKCAEITGDYSYKGTKNPLDYCKKAESLLTKLDDNKDYFRNKIIKVKAEIMSNDNTYDYDEVNSVRKQCNYYIIAEQESQNMNDEKKIEIWKDSANKYGYVDDYKNQIQCLNRAYEIMIPILNDFDYSRFDYNLWQIMYDLVIAWINLSDKTKATNLIREMYERTLDFYKGKNEEKFEYLYKIKQIANLYERAGDMQKAYRGYLIWLYVALSEKCDECIIMSYFENNKEMETIINELIAVISKTQIDNVDTLIEYKEAVEGLNKSGQELQLIQPLLDVIVNNYQNKEIEFK